MALKIQAKVTDNIVVTITPAPDVLCISCKQVIGKHLGKGKVVDELGNRMSKKCPCCGRNWLACIDGVIVIKTKKELIKC